METAVGVVAYENPALIAATLESLRAWTKCPHEVWILADGPDADTSLFLQSDPGLACSTTAQPLGMAACLNRLFKISKADVLVLLEQGAIVSPQWLPRLLNALAAKTIGMAGPSTNQCWNEQKVFSGYGDVRERSQQLFQKFGNTIRQLAPLYSLADFCYAIKRETIEAIGPADEAFGLGPCWEMDYNIRAERSGWHGVWVCSAYVERIALTRRRQIEETRRFEASKRRYQDRFCARLLRGEQTGYRRHCRGDACPNFAPSSLILTTPDLSLLGRPRPASVPATVSASQPLVSCIMLTRDRPEFVPRALHCFRTQDYPNLELIIVDDGTNPIGDLLPPDPRIRYYRLSRPLKVGAKRNHACGLALGEIVVHWDDDDWYSPHRVRIQVRSLQTGSAALSGTSRLYFYDAASQKAFLYRYSAGRQPWVAGTTLAYRRDFWQSHPFADIQVGEDSRFVWSAAPGSVRDLQDLTLCVAAIHANNVSPKRTSGSCWMPASAHEVLALMGHAPPALSPLLVSCIMPTFNRRPFIPLTLQCFRSQTYPRKELIVVDDGPDPVGDLLDGVAGVRYLRMRQRMTIGAKRNLACREAGGKIIAHWDDDDWYAPPRLERQIEALTSGADMTGLASNCMLHLATGEFWRITSHLHKRMFVGDIHGGTIVYKKDLLKGFLYPEANLAEDAALVRRAIGQKKKIVRVEEDGLFVYTRHARNAWQFEPGRFLDPEGWGPSGAPPGFSPAIREQYLAAAGLVS